MRLVRFSDASSTIDAHTRHTLTRCADEPGCLAAAAAPLGVDEVLIVRVTRREEATFIALTRVNALRPQLSEDAATLVATEMDALAFAAEAVEELWPGVELLP